MTNTLIDTFYGGLTERDGEAMASCYHDSAVFEDPIFGELDVRDTRDMWRMLCASDTDLRLRYNVAESKEGSATVQWIADYTFTSTGRSVTNEVTASLKFREGAIIDHRDHFSFWKWSHQALGIPGTLLGWTPMLKSKVRSTTRSNLEDFRASRT